MKLLSDCAVRCDCEKGFGDEYCPKREKHSIEGNARICSAALWYVRRGLQSAIEGEGKMAKKSHSVCILFGIYS